MSATHLKSQGQSLHALPRSGVPQFGRAVIGAGCNQAPAVPVGAAHGYTIDEVGVATPRADAFANLETGTVQSTRRVTDG
jgi:hypothetical protein